MLTQERIRQRLLIEELIRKRRSDDAARFIEIFRRSTIDPNPHQIEAAMFALQRVQHGGALLCDEVGLGKTIEAGLVITELRAQGRGHVLIILPLALATQWHVELEDLFSLPSTILGADTALATERGIYIIGREFATTRKGQELIESLGFWDLVVVDEAHELFAAIYNRFSKATGEFQQNLSKGAARRAAQIRELIAGAPILLLTATPMQNNLYELWGLVHYIDPDHRVLGKFNEFCMLFVTGEGGRVIEPGMEETLRQRLALVLKRTLRRQAQPFMKQPFRERHVVTANFSPEKLEGELYRLVQAWLAQEKLAAYRSGHRQLMALQLRRRMASSIEALVATLATIKERMLRIQKTGGYPVKDVIGAELSGYDEEDSSEAEEVDLELLHSDLVEVAHIEELAQQTLSLGIDVKKRKLLETIQQVQERALEGVVSEKVVIFTESIRTLDSLAEFLEGNGFKDKITTFSGSNTGRGAERAWKVWYEEVGKYQPRLDSSAAMRAALVHEFKTRTPIFIATEAGAKGLNLQFCNCLVNYDLPWNPQRIEQRIGRVHRYGQKHDVVIVNFINLSNHAEQRVYQLLNEKLHVFTETLGLSDTILNSPEVALDLESRINEMLNKCRTQQEIEEAFDRLTLELDAAQRASHDAKILHSKQLLNELDATVKARLGALEAEVGPALSKYDELFLEVLAADSPVEVIGNDGYRTLIRWRQQLYHLGPPNPCAECGEPLHWEHPQVQEVVQRCVAATNGNVKLADGNSGSWQVYKLTVRGLEEEERLLVVGEPRLPGWPECVRNVDAAMRDLKQEAERQQRSHVERLLKQMAARREDLNRYQTGSQARLQKKLEAADKARRLATSREALSKAQAQRTKILAEMEKVKREQAAEAQKELLCLDEQEQQIRLLQFVDVIPKLLFSVETEASVPGRASS